MPISGGRPPSLPSLARDRFWHSRRKRVTDACMYWLQTVYLADSEGLDLRRAAWERVRASSSRCPSSIRVWAAPRSTSESLAMSVSILLAYRATTPIAVTLLSAVDETVAVTRPSGTWQPLVLDVDSRLLERLPAHWCLVLPGDDEAVIEVAGQLAVEGMAPAAAFAAARALARP